jgi:YidC/Oxa1 family membrane protein insertase
MQKEKRVLLTILLTLLTLSLYQQIVGWLSPKKVVPKTAESRPVPEVGGEQTPPAIKPNGASAAMPAAAGSPATALVGDPAERTVRVENSDLIALFTNRGARLKSLRLKRYFDQKRDPQELIPSETAATYPLPFSVRVDDQATSARLNEAFYAVTGVPAGDGVTSTAIDLRFEYRDSSGLHAVKSFHLEPTSYIIAVSAAIEEGSRTLTATIEWGPAVGDLGENSRWVKKSEGLLFEKGKIRRLQTKDIAKDASYQGDFRYAGVDDNYFMTAVLTPGACTVTYQIVSIPAPSGPKDPPRELVSYAIKPAGEFDKPIKFFVGPKDYDLLKSIDVDLSQAVDFGMFRVLVEPLLRSLKWVNGYIGNYGWSIIILTVIINALMFPLRHKSVVSMRKMQEIQPEAKAIQDRYAKLKATDPAKQKMNEELMALYRARGVNPASGCVPMLLSMPVLLAMLALLQTSIELRGAPWIGWIHDLSASDPLYITPILMGLSQVWQQRMMPATGTDPAQQKMMMVLMPVMFTGMFLWAPAGLAIYYGVSNLWGIGQQYLTNYLIGPPKVRTVRPPAERRIKRAGAGNKAEG